MNRSKSLASLSLIAMIVALGFGGCGTQEYESAEPEPLVVSRSAQTESASAFALDDAPVATTLSADGETVPGADTAAPRARIVTLTLTMTVDDVPGSAEALRTLIEARGGYVESADVAATEGGWANVQMRVPENQLAETRRALREVGEITHENESVEDVTAARADLAARLRNAGAYEARLIEMVADRTAQLSDVLEAERELSRIRESIERLEAETRTLEGRIAYAQVHVSLQPVAPVAPPETSYVDDPIGSMVHGAEMGARALWTVVVTIGVAVAAASPLLLVLTLFAGIIWTLRRLWSRRRGASPTAF